MVVTEGETVIASPVPAEVPSHDPVNHSVIAPVPFDPPDTVNVVPAPLQIVVVPVAPVGGVDKVFTVMVAVPAISAALAVQPAPALCQQNKHLQWQAQA